MALRIGRTGIGDYLDGSANIKMLLVGGPGVGKTRFSSYWPDPFLIDCENGRGSLADRGVDYVDVRSSKDMLDALAFLKSLEGTPKSERRYKTVVVDTLDSFQRKVKDEWLQASNQGVFKGYDAWGYLDSKIQMLMTRLLNLDYSVLILCHYKDKTFKDSDGTESRELMLALQGDIKDSAFNDVGLVGWMDTYWAPDVDGNRVEKRGITFKRTPERPFLKDRFAVTPTWMPVEFSEQDYTQFSLAFAAKADDLPDSQEVGEVPDAPPPTGVVAPSTGGPVPPRPPRERALADLTKPELIDKAKALGLSPKGNAVKAEIITMIEQAPPAGSEPGPSRTTDSEPGESARTAHEQPSPRNEGTEPDEPGDSAERVTDPEPGSPPETSASDHDTAVGLVEDRLDAAVIEERTPEPAAAEPAPEPTSNGHAPDAECEDCGKDLTGEIRDHVELSFIKFRKRLCSADYLAAVAARKAAKR